MEEKKKTMMKKKKEKKNIGQEFLILSLIYFRPFRPESIFSNFRNQSDGSFSLQSFRLGRRSGEMERRKGEREKRKKRQKKTNKSSSSSNNNNNNHNNKINQSQHLHNYNSHRPPSFHSRLWPNSCQPVCSHYLHRNWPPPPSSTPHL